MKKSLLIVSSNCFYFFQKCGKKNYLSLLFLLLLSISSLNAQVNLYTYGEVSGGSYTPISGGTDLFGASPNDQETAVGSEIPIGFTFNFNGTNYTNLRVNANGYIVFGGTNVLASTTPISGTGNYAGAVSGYGRDLIFSSYGSTPIYSAGTYPSSVSYVVAGSSPNRVFTVQFQNMARFNPGSTVAPFDGLVNFQIKLYETSGLIQVVHAAQITPTTLTALVGQYGLRGTSNTDFSIRQISSGSPWTATTAGTPLATQGVNYRNNCWLGATFTSTWTPPCYAPITPLTVGSVLPNSATIGWTAPTPAPSGGYQYEIRTSGAAGSGSTGLVTSGTVSGVSNNITSLPEGTTLFWYVRSSCGSSWVTGPSFTTSCNPKNIPYIRNFDETDYIVPAIPQCNSIQNMGTGNNWVTSDVTAQSTPAQFLNKHLLYDATVGVGGTQAANVWFYTAGLNLTAGQTYKLSYKYGGSTVLPTITNRMLIKYGTSASDAGMTIALADHNSIKSSPLTNNINFTVATTGVYYIGFKIYSDANQDRLFLDDIQVTQPACKPPTALTVSAITGSSATATWTAPSPAPGSGYAYYLTASTNINATAMVVGTRYQILAAGTTNFTSYGAASNAVGTIFTCTGSGFTGTGVVSIVPSTPSYEQVATGTVTAGTTLVNLLGLGGSTTYYLWVRGFCGTNDLSEWSQMSTFTTLLQPAYCTPTCVSTASYITNFTTTNGFSNIANTSGAAVAGYTDYTTLNVSQTAGNSVNFSVSNNDTVGGAGIAIWVDWNNDGVFTNSAPNERVYNSGVYIYGGPVTGTITVPAGQPIGSYRIRIVSDYWATSPNPCSFSASGPRGEAEDYLFIVLTPPPALTLNINSSTQCAGVNSPLVTITPATVGNYTNYSWSPSSGVSGNSTTGYTFNSSATVTYTLTGFNSSTLATNTATFRYTANPLPTPITISPASATLCPSGPAQQLVASGGIVSGIAVLAENFNTTALGNVPPTGWTTTNTGSGIIANGDFTIRPTGYDPPTWTSAINSNDSSQFIFTDADSQGSGAINNTTLVSPVFDLSSYSSATLSFWHFYQMWGSDTYVGVEISTNGGGSWTNLQSYTGTSQGSRNNFSNANINLNSYVGVGFNNLRLRFRYNSTYGFGWAIDNILVSGSSSSSTIWSPTTGLFTDAAATIPYTGTATNTVYALPNTTTTYTATASTPSPNICSTTKTVTITTTVSTGTASNDQILCGGTPVDLTITGSTGSIQWQYADNSAFTVGVTSISGATSTTLTSAQIGSLAADRYFRVALTNGPCTAYSNVVSILTSSSATVWNGSSWSNGLPSSTKAIEFQGNFTSSVNALPLGNISACSVLVSNSANVLFDIGTLTVFNQVNVTSGTLTFADKASLYQVGAISNAPGNYSGANTGAITYYRATTPVFKFDYTYWSSPVLNQNLLALSPSSPTNLFLQFNSTTNSWQYIANPATTTMLPGKGYVFRAPSTFPVGAPSAPQVFLASFYGVPNNGTFTYPIVGGSNQFNLIGNPYPSALSADLFVNDPLNSSILDGTIYLWTHNTPLNASYQYSGSDYALYNTLGGIGTASTNPGLNTSIPTGKIASGQGFFIKGLSSGNATFKNSMRVAGNNDQFFKMTTSNETHSEIEKHRYWIEISNSAGAYKQILVGYIENGTLGIDRGLDGEMVDVGNEITLYTRVENTKLSIQGRPLPFDVSDTVPMGYKSTVDGSFTISLSLYDGLFTSQHVYLEDKVLNVIHDLNESDYTFTTAIGTFNDRFVLRYTNEALSTNTPVFDQNTVVVYKNNQGLHIDSGAVNMATVSIFDIRGRLLAAQKQVNRTTTVFTTLPTTNEVLLVRIESEDGVIVTKKVAY